jgi:hypothetical protein
MHRLSQLGDFTMVMLVQLLCPLRHCLYAGAYQVGESSLAECCRSLEELIEKAGLARHCGICGSTDVHYEEGRTKWATLQEAAGPIAAMTLANINTRLLLDSLGMSFDSKRITRERKPHVN